MALSKDEVMNIVRGFLITLNKNHTVKEAYIFGSYASNRAKDYSDIDLALVFASLRTAEDLPFDEDFEIFHEAQQYNSRLEVVCYLKDEFDSNRGELIKRIKKEGIKVI